VTGSPLSTAELGELLGLAVTAAEAGGKVTLAHFRSPRLGIDLKDDGSPVTIADRGSERAIRALLGDRTPGIDILGEEEGLDGGNASLRWVVDPIDGTVSFTRGIPLYGVLIGLRETATNRGLVGVLHLPALGETYSAAIGLGAHLGGRRLQLDADVPEGRPGPVLSAGDPNQFNDAGIPDDYAKVSGFSRYFRGYTDCFGHALALRGAVDAHADPGLSAWDLGPIDVLFGEAGGGYFCRPSISGGGFDAVVGRTNVVADVVRRLGWGSAAPS
jgi:fructose-1,6-bisphosphatase/inositol monophosphatase family enzyme